MIRKIMCWLGLHESRGIDHKGMSHCKWCRYGYFGWHR